MHSQILSTIPVRSVSPTYRPRRPFGAHLAALLLATVAVQTACDPHPDDEVEAAELADADNDAPPNSIGADAIQELEAAFAEADPDEQDSELEDAFIEAHIEAIGPDTLTLSLPPASSATPYPANCFGKGATYQVTINTGDMLYAGTGAMVSYRFRGTHAGQSKWTSWMEKSGAGSMFERGHSDHFDTFFKSLGTLDRIELKHNNAGASAGWYVKTVSVHDTCSEIGWSASIYRWLDKKPGLSIVKTLYES